MLNNALRKEINGYINNVNGHIDCSAKKKRKFLSEFKNDIYEYVEKNNDLTVNDIISEFGTPEKVATSFNCTQDHPSTRTLSIKKIVFSTVIIVLAVITITFISEKANGYSDKHFTGPLTCASSFMLNNDQQYKMFGR